MSGTSEILTTQVDLPGLMKVLGNNLYSTPSVAIRELVQNAHDSCVRRQIEVADSFEPQIVVSPDPVRRRLIIDDNGAGLTRDEIVRYLATVGTGYTSQMRDQGQSDTLIGYFGLGFLSAFFVSTKVELITTSYQSPEKTWVFTSTGGERYHLASGEERPVGTRVILHLNEHFQPLGEPAVVEDLLRRYCCLLPLPIHLEDGSSPAVNRPIPPWRAEKTLHPVRRQAVERELVARFEDRFEPLCVFPLTGEGETHAEGLVWIQGGATYGTSDNRNVSVFVRGMLVDSDARELLPAWAGFCGAIIESDSLTPTASREDLQRNEAFESTAAQLRRSLVEGLSRLPKTQPAAWRRVLRMHNEALIGAALSDEGLFELLADVLKVPTSEGELTLPVIYDRADGRVHVSLGDGAGYEEVLFRATQVPVVLGTRYGAMPFAERHAAREGKTVVRLGTKDGNRALFAPVDLPTEHVDILTSLLGRDGLELLPTRFSPASLPVVLAPDREVALKRRVEREEADRRISSAILSMARMFTETIDDEITARLFVNLDSPVIQRLMGPPTPRTRQAATIVRAMADLFTDRREEDALQVDTGAAFQALSEAVVALLEA